MSDFQSLIFMRFFGSIDARGRKFFPFSCVMKKYPKGTVSELLNSPLVTDATREALNERLKLAENYRPAFFDDESFALLQAICRRLIPQTEVDCAVYIDRNFSLNISNGWRYDRLPNLAETFKSGLCATNQTSKEIYGKDFQQLDEHQQDEILSRIEQKKVSGGIWNDLPSELFFEELLAQTVAVYYAHPLAQEKIGYAGMADAPGWTQIRLNELEPREPRLLES